MEKLGVLVLSALEKRWILSQGRELVIPCATALNGPQERSAIAEHKGKYIGKYFRTFGIPVYI